MDGIPTLDAQALGLACTLEGDVQLACAAICASRTTRNAVLKCGTRTLSVDLNNNKKGFTSSTERLAQQACWLSKYGSLVRQLNVSVWFSSETAVQGLLQLSLAAVQAEVLHLDMPHVGILRCLHNRHLRELRCSSKHLAAADPDALSQLRKLTLEAYPHPMTLPQGIFARLPMLSTLVLVSPTRLDDIMAAALQLPRLEQLQLYNPDGTAAALRQLNHLPWLQQLRLEYTRSTVAQGDLILEHADAWASLHRLVSLKCHCYEAPLPGMTAQGIKAATQVTSLVLGAAQQQQDVPLPQILAPLERLQHLGLCTESLQDTAPVAALGKLTTRLTSLSMCCSTLTPQVVKDLCTLSNLKELRLRSVVTPEQLVDVAGQLTGLQHLVLFDGEVLSQQQPSLLLQLPAILGKPVLPALQQLVLVGGGWKKVEEAVRGVRPLLPIQLVPAMVYAEWLAAPAAGRYHPHSMV